jgi:hypothetical protein
MLHVDFVETGFVGQMDFIFVRYSTVNNGIMSTSRFRIPDNVMKVTRTWESMFKISRRFSYIIIIEHGRRPFCPQEDCWCIFLLEAESIPGP